jgi:hypothetical protein
MHRLEDIRFYGPAHWYGRWGGVPTMLRVYEVDANGSPHTLVRVELRSDDAAECSPYRCECGYEFGSWEEAKDHIELDDQGVPAR